jgi:hypothetical protein
MKTLYEMKVEALAALASVRPGDIKVDTIRETAIDIEVENDEAGFVLQEYPDGTVRRAYFFIGQHEVDLDDAELEAVANAIYS